jgi:ribose-phosphate pyrophosphokinase
VSVDSSPIVFATTNDLSLAARICELAELRLGKLEERAFEGGEFKLRPLESVRGRDVVVVASLAGSAHSSAAERLTRLCFLLAVLRDNGAARRTALIPYLAFARKDQRTRPRDPVNTRYVALLLEASGLNHLIAIDVHNSAAVENAFRIPVDHLSAAPMFVRHLGSIIADQPVVVVSPDVGGIKRAQRFQELLAQSLCSEVEIAFIAKRRVAGRLSDAGIVGEATGRVAIVIDDLCATGATLKRAASALRASGASSVIALVTHTPMIEGVSTVVDSELFDQVITTNTVTLPNAIADDQAGMLHILDTAPLFAAALDRICRRKPLSPLLNSWPLEAP